MFKTILSNFDTFNEFTKKGNEDMQNLNPFSDVQDAINQNFPELSNVIEAVAATVASLLLQDNSNPLSLILVGVSSIGKTTVIMVLKLL